VDVVISNDDEAHVVGYGCLFYEINFYQLYIYIYIYMYIYIYIYIICVCVVVVVVMELSCLG
jgi:hypothetical protein